MPLQRLEESVTEWTNKHIRDLEEYDTALIKLLSEKEVIEGQLKNLLLKVSNHYYHNLLHLIE